MAYVSSDDEPELDALGLGGELLKSFIDRLRNEPIRLYGCTYLLACDKRMSSLNH